MEIMDIGNDTEACWMTFMKTQWLFRKDMIFSVQAFEMKAAMMRLGVQPTVVTYTSLVCVCVRLGDVSALDYEMFSNLDISVSLCLYFTIFS